MRSKKGGKQLVVKKTKTKQIVVNCKTGKQRIKTVVLKEYLPYVEPKGVNLEKLKQLLLDKKIISDPSEIE